MSSQDDILDLEPQEVMRYFAEICAIPHGSGHIKAISDYCIAFADEHKLKRRQDEAGNVVIWKKASEGCEKAQPLILQGHLDMVAVKEPGSERNLVRQGIIPETDGTYIWGKETSLGGDDGIAIAYSLAILADDSLVHPPLVVIFTVNEEIGMLGAAALDTSDIHAHTMLNMDSEQEGVFLLSCAGGATVSCHFPFEKMTSRGSVLRFTISGLTGGHSGQEINKGRLNANVLFGRFLLDAPENLKISIAEPRGGEKDNAIAHSFTCLLVTEPEQEADLQAYIESFGMTIKKEYESIEPHLAITAEKTKQEELAVIAPLAARGIFNALILMPDGVQRFMPEMPEMVETSLNLGILQTVPARNRRRTPEVIFTYSVRSASASQKENLIKKIAHLTGLCGGYTQVDGVYPAWEYREQSPLRECMEKVYQRLYWKEPVEEAIHAGVECGIFAEKIPDLDCVSIGPNMLDIHTTKEKLDVASVQRTWKFVLEVLKGWAREGKS